MSLFGNKKATTHGSAGWMDLRRAIRRNILHPLPKDGLLVGDWQRHMLLPVYYRGAANIITIAPPGSGKGTSMLIPNALRHPFIVIFDPDGEITKVSALAWRREGYRFYCINPWGMHVEGPHNLPSHSVNPFDGIDPQSRTFASDANDLACKIVTRNAQEHEPRWKDKAEGGIQAIIMHMATSLPPEMRNMVQLRRYIMGNDAGWRALVRDMQDNTSDEFIRNQANEWERMLGPVDKPANNREFSSIQSTMEQSMKWVEDDVVRDAIGTSDVRFDDLKGTDEDGKPLKGCIISIVAPIAYLESHAAFVRMMIGCALAALKKGRLAQRRVLFMVDEAAVLGHVKEIKLGLATLRKRKVWFHLVYQSVGQIKGAYGDEFGAIMGCCGLQQFLATGDPETAEYVSRMCGDQTIEVITTNGRGQESKSFTKRPLMTPMEVKEIRDDEQIVFMGNNPPMLLKARPYWERPSLRGMFYDNKSYGPTKGLPVTLPFEIAYGLTTRVAGWFIGPSKTVMALGVLLVAGIVSGAGVKVDDVMQGRTHYCAYQTLAGKAWWTFPGACGVVKIGSAFYG